MKNIFFLFTLLFWNPFIRHATSRSLIWIWWAINFSTVYIYLNNINLNFYKYIYNIERKQNLSVFISIVIANAFTPILSIVSIRSDINNVYIK